MSASQVGSLGKEGIPATVLLLLGHPAFLASSLPHTTKVHLSSHRTKSKGIHWSIHGDILRVSTLQGMKVANSPRDLGRLMCDVTIGPLSSIRAMYESMDYVLIHRVISLVSRNSLRVIHAHDTLRLAEATV